MTTNALFLVASFLVEILIALPFDRYLVTRGARLWVRGAALLPPIALAIFGVMDYSRFDPTVQFLLVPVAVLWALVLLAHRQYLRWRATRYQLVQLCESVLDLQELGRNLMAESQPSSIDIQVFKDAVGALERFRALETSEYVSLVVSEMTHFVEGSTWPEMDTAEERLAELERGFQIKFAQLGVEGRVRMLVRSQ